MFRHVIVTASAVTALAMATPADAQAKGASSTAGSVRVVLAPLSTLGSEAKSRATKRIKKVLARSLSAVGGYKLVADKDLQRKLRRARKARLRNCDGSVNCLTELGALMNAKLVVHAEVGGLGDVQVVYLKLIDVTRRRELRSTTLELGRKTNARLRAKAAAIRLLAPKRFVGNLVTKVDVKGATIYVDGQRVGTSPAKPIPLSVGTHALRITHPEFRDFVRFVSIDFDKSATVKADMLQFPIVSSGINPRTGKPNIPDPKSGIIYKGTQATPWYRKWYSVAGAAALVFLTSAVTVGLLADGIDADREKVVRPPM